MRKVSLTILLILVIILSTITVVNADEGDKATFALTTKNTDVKAGDEVTVNLVISNIEGFSGINTFTATKVFDSTIFEYQGTVGQNGWEVKGDSTNIVLKSNSHSTSGIIAVMKFKALKAVDDTTIKLTNLDTCGDDGDVYFEDGNVNEPSIRFKVTSNEQNPGQAPEGNGNQTPGNNNSGSNNKPGNTNGGNKVNNDKTTATGSKIPQTGDSYVATTLVAAGIILAVILFAKYIIFVKNTK